MKKKHLAQNLVLHRETLKTLVLPGSPRVAAAGDTNGDTVCSACLRVCVSFYSGCC